MKAREKFSKTFRNFNDFHSCEQHPHFPPVGICPHCLNERLMKLVCADCGDRRLPSCSCPEIEIRRNSCSTVDFAAGVGGFSFFAENDGLDPKRRSLLRRSNSNGNGGGAERSGGFNRIKRLFSKRRAKIEFCDENRYGFEARNSGFGSVFPIKERERESSGSAVDEGGFFDVKLESWNEGNQEFCAGRRSRASDCGVGYRRENFEFPQILGVGGSRRSGVSGNGGSCRITMSERGLKQERRNSKVWNWIFKKRSASDHDEK